MPNLVKTAPCKSIIIFSIQIVNASFAHFCATFALRACFLLNFYSYQMLYVHTKRSRFSNTGFQIALFFSALIASGSILFDFFCLRIIVPLPLLLLRLVNKLQQVRQERQDDNDQREGHPEDRPLS